MSGTGEALRDDDVLGPFQMMWDAWNEADELIKEKPLEHFRKAAEIQFQELTEHWDRHDRERASREAADLVSVAFNVLRWMNYSCEDIARIAQDRAEHRMKGQALGILQKYEDTYGI
ncbi:hypothetical protein GCM10009557_25000 [Virgisporangium ochraceum]|uniref:Uncharacterized protein n=1 Tax=Virgisporangium ochraceum TaxID=65505 RepID=A0A8J3ZTU2_9ACTN|nr:hypothetical protein [Virgisporangium ochraceum]GIJ70369.1 hypothetical protein Voc01_052860 [Virgisporangium ochraceum]